MPKATIWSATDKSSVDQDYASICDFLSMLNEYPATKNADITLKSLFDEKINPILTPKIPKQNVKVLYPFGGADAVTGFLLPNVSEVTIVDYAYFFDENTKLNADASASYMKGLQEGKNFEGYSGITNTFDITGRQTGLEFTTIETSINTVYNDSSLQTCYAILMRLKTQLGAHFQEFSFIDPLHKDLGFVVKFLDRNGTERVLRYYQRSDCGTEKISTRGPCRRLKRRCAHYSYRTRSCQCACCIIKGCKWPCRK